MFVRDGIRVNSVLFSVEIIYIMEVLQFIGSFLELCRKDSCDVPESLSRSCEFLGRKCFALGMFAFTGITCLAKLPNLSNFQDVLSVLDSFCFNYIFQFNWDFSLSLSLSSHPFCSLCSANPSIWNYLIITVLQNHTFRRKETWLILMLLIKQHQAWLCWTAAFILSDFLIFFFLIIRLKTKHFQLEKTDADPFI